MDEHGRIFILEINSMASLGRTGSYVHAAGIAGFDFKALVNKMLDVAVVRYFANKVPHEMPGPSSKGVPAHIRVRGFLRSRQDQYLKLLQKAVNTNTYVRNVEGVNEFGNIIRKELMYLGFSHEVIPQVEVGNLLFFTNSLDGKYDILLLGALDNRKKIAEQEYYSDADQKITGTGIWEHKGGIITAIAAIQSLRFLRMLRKTKIGILLTTDDSLQGKFARDMVLEKSQEAQYILGLHGGDLSGSLITSRSGSATYRINMHLKNTEDSNMVAFASGVFTKMINNCCELSIDDNSLVIAPNQTSLTTNIMRPYAHGETLLSVRYNDPALLTEVDKSIRKTIPGKKYIKQLHFQIDGGAKRNPMVETEKVIQFWDQVKLISNKLDIRLTREHRWSSSDICFVDATKSVLDGFGPIGLNEQDRSEYILRHSLLERALLIAMTIKEISGL
jgi:D-alanine-D-alanine ligase